MTIAVSGRLAAALPQFGRLHWLPTGMIAVAVTGIECGMPG